MAFSSSLPSVLGSLQKFSPAHQDKMTSMKQEEAWKKERSQLEKKVFQQQIAENERESEKESKIQKVSSDLELLEGMRDSVELYRTTGQEGLLKTSVKSLAENGKSSMLPVVKGLLDGDEATKKQFDTIYDRTLQKAYQLGVRDAPANHKPEVKASKNKKTGDIEYVNILDPKIRETHSPLEDDDIDPDWRPAIDRKTGKMQRP